MFSLSFLFHIHPNPHTSAQRFESLTLMSRAFPQHIRTHINIRPRPHRGAVARVRVFVCVKGQVRWDISVPTFVVFLVVIRSTAK